MSNISNPGATTGASTTRTQDQIREKASDLKHQAADMANRAKETAQEKMGELRDSASEYVEMGREKAMELSDSLETQIRQQPMKAVLIAAGVGFVLGMCWTRR